MSGDRDASDREPSADEDSETKLVSWHDADGQIGIASVPRTAVCLSIGGWCAACEAVARSAPDSLRSVIANQGRILAIGDHLVCTNGLHPVPPLVVLLRDETRRDVDVVDTRGPSW